MRVNGVKVTKTATPVTPGDVLTFAQSRVVRVVRIEALTSRRGPASEAQDLYTDMTPEIERLPRRVGPRPTKKDRRDMEVYRQDDT